MFTKQTQCLAEWEIWYHARHGRKYSKHGYIGALSLGVPIFLKSLRLSVFKVEACHNCKSIFFSNVNFLEEDEVVYNI